MMNGKHTTHTRRAAEISLAILLMAACANNNDNDVATADSETLVSATEAKPANLGGDVFTLPGRLNQNRICGKNRNNKSDKETNKTDCELGKKSGGCRFRYVKEDGKEKVFPLSAVDLIQSQKCMNKMGGGSGNHSGCTWRGDKCQVSCERLANKTLCEGNLLLLTTAATECKWDKENKVCYHGVLPAEQELKKLSSEKNWWTKTEAEGSEQISAVKELALQEDSNCRLAILNEGCPKEKCKYNNEEECGIDCSYFGPNEKYCEQATGGSQ